MTRSDLLVGALAVIVVLIIAAFIYEEKKNSDKSSMQAVYGRSFTNVPHSNLKAASEAVTRAAVEAPWQFKGSDAYGGSFSRIHLG